MLDSLRGLYVFAHVAETRSFSRAAERLEITRSAVSKHIQQLESALSVQLIVRTTRKLVLTDAGERVFASCQRIAADVEAAREAAHDQQSVIAGKLRVTAPNALAPYLIPPVSEFLQQQKAVSIDLVFDDSMVDLIEQRIDIALRVGGRTDATFVSRRVTKVALYIVASPGYLEKHGHPRTARDLTRHEWLIHSSVGGTTQLTLRKGDSNIVVHQQGRLSCNSGPSNIAAAIAGHGLMAVPDFEVAVHLRAGTLVRLLPNWKIQEVSLALVFPPRRHVLGRVRALADLLAARFRVPPWQVLN
jgi:DNA-binding transcriptional LysR family regulator